MMQLGTPLPTAEAFYAQRDSRAAIEQPLSQVESQRIAIVVPADAVASPAGLEIALFWVASIIRRMGRAFAEVILVSSKEFQQSKSCTAKTAEMSIRQWVETELKSADPYADVEWRVWSETIDLSDASSVIWLGTLPLGAPHKRMLAINACGWVSILHETPEADLSLSPPAFDAAPAAIIFAACMAAAKVFSDAFGARQGPGHIAFALDSGSVSSNPAVYRKWFSEGMSLPVAAPWKNDLGAEPSLQQLLVVSAGGIGGNFCRILRDSYFRIKSAYVIEPDTFDISNLNRAIGVGLDMAMKKLAKSSFAADALQFCSGNVMPVQAAYESWATPEIMGKFRSVGSAVVVGVDQVRTRLNVGSDWPSLLLNGATAGATFSTSIHVSSSGGCIGCWYGQSEAIYAATRLPMACVAGVAPGAIQVQQVASYPFVSVAAAAHMVAMLARSTNQNGAVGDYAGTLTRMSLRLPENTHVSRIQINARCLLLCAEGYLQPLLGRHVIGGA